MIRTAIDTNIISALWSRESTVSSVIHRFDHATDEGRLIMSAPVFIELMGYRGMTVEKLHAFIDTMDITVEFDLDEKVWQRAGEAYAFYAAKRRASGGKEPKRFLADFLIGAHAIFRADRLLTEDVSRYKTYFPELKLLSVTK